MLNRVQGFLIRSNNEYNRQFGFQPNVSTADDLVDKFGKTRFAKSNVCFCILPAIKKAFDTINGEKLMMKLDQYRFRGVAFTGCA